MIKQLFFYVFMSYFFPGFLWLSLDDVHGIRATSLIFGKSSTTTSTTTAQPDTSDEEVSKEVQKSPLTVSVEDK